MSPGRSTGPRARHSHKDREAHPEQLLSQINPLLCRVNQISGFSGLDKNHHMLRVETDPEERRDLSKDASPCRNALALFRTWIEWGWEGAEMPFRRAIELRPSFAEARGFYAHCLMIFDLTEGEPALPLGFSMSNMYI